MGRQATTRRDGRNNRSTPRIDFDPKLMSSTQLLQSVFKGLKITFDVFDGEPIEGYLAGIDPLYFKVLEPKGNTFRIRLVNRSTNPAMDFAPESTYEDESAYDQMEAIIGPFRTAMRSVSRRPAPGGAAS